MGRDFFGHQQLVSAVHARRRMLLIAFALAVGGIVLASTVARPSGDRSAVDSSAGHAGKGYAREFEDIAAKESSLDRFLDDLADMPVESRVSRDTLGARALTVHEDGDLPDLAGGVMRAYEQVDACTFVCGGYLDLKGDVWGSVFRCGEAWVDVVYVTASEDGECSTARIVRLTPEGASS